MGKRTDALAKKVNGMGPAWLTKYAPEDTSLEGMDQYRILPMFKLVQPTAALELTKAHGVGSCIIRPGDALVWKQEDPAFQFVAQFFWTEFYIRSDLRDKESPYSLDRTYDPVSEIAKKSRDPDRRLEIYADHENKPAKDQYHKRYIESLRFAGEIYGDHPLAGTPIILAFEAGEFTQGKNFISAIKLRKQRIEEQSVSVPLWAQVWNFTVGFRDRGDKKWYGIDFQPAEPSLIANDDVERMQATFVELRELHLKKKLFADETKEGNEAEVKEGDEF